jgi:hypothetical protein
MSCRRPPMPYLSVAPTMIVGFTGTQIGMSPNQMAQFLPRCAFHLITEFHHGMCIGADEQAEELVLRCFPHVIVYGHPPISNRKMSIKCRPHHMLQPREYLERNKKIVDRCDVLLAAPKGPEELRSGTWSTIRYAKKKGIPVEILIR